MTNRWGITAAIVAIITLAIDASDARAQGTEEPQRPDFGQRIVTETPTSLIRYNPERMLYKEQRRLSKLQEKWRKEWKCPSRHTVALNAGIATLIGNRIFLEQKEWTGDDNTKGKGGLAFGAEYQYVFRKHYIGIGVAYKGFRSDRNKLPGGKVAKLDFHFVAPEFVCRFKLKKKWMFQTTVGIGYARYRNESLRNRKPLAVTANGCGYDIRFGFEYLCSDHVGIGASAGMFGMFFPEKDLCPDNVTGMQCEAGMRFYFN